MISPPVLLRTLGSVDLCGPNQEALRTVESQPKRMALLIYLAVAYPGKMAQRDTVIGLLWPEHNDEHARAALRQALHGLRVGLGEDAVLARGDHEIGIDPKYLWCDAAAFESALDRGAFREAVSLYGGPFANGMHVREALEFAHWMDQERAHLAREQERALEHLAGVAEQGGDFPQAVDWWERVLACNPYNARAVTQLMGVLENMGDPVRAIQYAESHAKLLAEEFGATANPDVEELAERLRTHPKSAGLNGSEVAQTQPQVVMSNAVPSGKLRRRRRFTIRQWAIAVVGVTLAAVVMSPLLNWLTDRHVAAADVATIAVLPFDFHGPAADAYWAVTATEAIQSSLAGLTGLRVIAFFGDPDRANGNYPRIAKELGVAYLLAGRVSVEDAGDANRELYIMAQLIRASNGEIIWGSWDAVPVELSSISRIHRDIAQGVAGSLDLALQGPQSAIDSTVPLENREAREH